MKFYEIPQNLDTEIGEFEELISRFKRGDLSANQLKIHRVPFGVYEQRQDGTYMVRVRSNAGAITPAQLKRTAEIAKTYASDFLHVTTRQEIQIHDVDIDDVITIVRALREVDLSPRGGGGNTVRNVMASYDSGLFDKDTFDVTPVAYALTNELICDKESWNLPRKYKITFSSSNENNANAHVQDLGVIAKIENGIKGFQVYACGGMGSNPDLGVLLHDFVPAEEIFIVAEAIKRVFSQYGNRKNKHKARLRYLIKDLGQARFTELYNEEAAILKNEGNLLTINWDLFENKNLYDGNLSPVTLSDESYKKWEKRFVKKQKQDGLSAVLLPLFLGNISSDNAIKLADLMEHFGENSIRFTMGQNIHLRNIPHELLGTVYQALVAVSDLTNSNQLLGNTVGCTGADTCRLGICLPKGALRAIRKHLDQSSINFDLFPDFKINISGCPNTCGQHMIADLGFFGKLSKNGQDSYPAYNVVVGARAVIDNARLAERITDVSARSLPQFIEKVLEKYSTKVDTYPTFADYVDNEGREELIAIADSFRSIPSFDDDKNYYFDWGAREIFSLAGRGQGECSAGLFDMIDFDIKLAEASIKEIDAKGTVDANDVYQLLIPVTRMLLITKGIEAKTEAEVFSTFRKLFIDTGLVDVRYTALLDKATQKNTTLKEEYRQTVSLFEDMKRLYGSMDNSLKFPKELGQTQTAPKPVEEKEENTDSSIRRKDLSGVPCPMNFVKTKIELSQMKEGELLEIILDDGEPIKNVPRSVEGEGHNVLEQEQSGGRWRVLIKKAAE